MATARLGPGSAQRILEHGSRTEVRELLSLLFESLSVTDFADVLVSISRLATLGTSARTEVDLVLAEALRVAR